MGYFYSIKSRRNINVSNTDRRWYCVNTRVRIDFIHLRVFSYKNIGFYFKNVSIVVCFTVDNVHIQRPRLNSLFLGNMPRPLPGGITAATKIVAEVQVS